MRAGYKEELTVTRGTQRKYKFPNGFGASVVMGPYSYGGTSGLWELAVLDANGDLTYDTPVTEGVLGYLSESEVDIALDQIEAL